MRVADQLLDPIIDCLTPDVARCIVNAQLDQNTQAMIDELAEKANRGTLTASERDCYSEIVEYIDLVSIIKLKARRKIQNA